jgi:DNA-binding MarR family transcriptional regulator
MSSTKKDVLVREIGQAVMQWQDATQAYDEQVGRTFSLNTAERHCLSLLVGEGSQTASAIARRVHLTPAAVTALLDRLERRGYVRRRSDPEDRRKVMVEAADTAMKLAHAAYGPIGKAGEEMLERFTREELEVVHRFVTGAVEMQRRFLEQSRAGAKSARQK